MASKTVEFFYTWDQDKMPKGEYLYARASVSGPEDGLDEALEVEKQNQIDAMVETIVRTRVLPYLRYEELVRE